MKKLGEKVSEFFSDPKKPSSFSGLNKIYGTLKKSGEYNGLKYKQLKPILAREETYQMFKPVKKKFPRNKVITSYKGDQLDLDLLDMSQYSKENDNVKYLLTGIDIFSRYGYAFPLKSKSQNDVLDAIKKITERERYDNVRSDKGGEFNSKKLLNYFKSKNINHFVTQNEDIKSNYVERLNKTLKQKLHKYMYQNQTHRYLDVLKDIVDSYNSTIHRSIKMKPKDVNKNTKLLLWAKQYLKPSERVKKRKHFYKYDIGDLVRIGRSTNVFSRGYDQKWTGEVFKIIKRRPRQGLPIYELSDYDDEKIKGTFYEPELQQVELGDDPIFKIEKILKTKNKQGKRIHLVSWLGWSKKFNSWVKDEDLKAINKPKT